MKERVKIFSNQNILVMQEQINQWIFKQYDGGIFILISIQYQDTVDSSSALILYKR